VITDSTHRDHSFHGAVISAATLGGDICHRAHSDLLCPDARVAVELDGGHHLGDPKAYRRDRRKDQLLQENGYFVLRFLAEDVGKCLDQVLDAILRTMSGRRRSHAVDGRA
jgi:very-short-patch-repair endonuclease